jgi:hypothetical protein
MRSTASAMRHSPGYLRSDMQILAALFIDGIEQRQAEGGAARLDLQGVQFSALPPSPYPFVWAPHLAVIIHNEMDGSPTAALEVVFRRGDEQIARNVQPLQIEQGKFNRSLVRAEMEFTEPGTVHAHCRIDMGPETVVPYTILETD